MSRNYIVVDRDTGEVLDDYKVVSQRKFEQSVRFAQMSKNKSTEQFVFFDTNHSDELSKLSNKSVARLFNLAAYLDYDGDALRVSRNSGMTDKELKAVLRLDRKVCDGFIDEATEFGWLYRDDGGVWHIGHDAFCKGSVDKKKNNTYTRIFTNSYRMLYIGVSPTTHTHIGRLLKLLPYVNTHWNVLCTNTNENFSDFITPISMQQFCDITGFSKTNAKYLNNVYNNLSFTYGIESQLLCWIEHEKYQRNDRIIINPNIVYAGDMTMRNRVFAQTPFVTKDRSSHGNKD